MKIINLLPKLRQQELRYVAMQRALWVVCGLSVMSFILVFAAQGLARFYLQAEASDIQNQINVLKEQAKNTKNTKVKDDVKAVNDLALDFKNLADAAPKWTKVIKAFVPLPPEGVKVRSFTMDPLSKRVIISGTSPTRELVIEFYNNILADKNNFYNIDYPLENVAKPKDISYHFTFYIQDSLLK